MISKLWWPVFRSLNVSFRWTAETENNNRSWCVVSRHYNEGHVAWQWHVIDLSKRVRIEDWIRIWDPKAPSEYFWKPAVWPAGLFVSLSICSALLRRLMNIPSLCVGALIAKRLVDDVILQHACGWQHKNIRRSRDVFLIWDWKAAQIQWTGRGNMHADDGPTLAVCCWKGTRVVLYINYENYTTY